MWKDKKCNECNGCGTIKVMICDTCQIDDGRWVGVELTNKGVETSTCQDCWGRSLSKREISEL